METRVESDSIGRMMIPQEAYYGVQTQRGYENFRITGRRMPAEMVESLVEIKKAAARMNQKTGQLETEVADAIVAACDEILAGALRDQFILDPIQGGAGTSANMNANEVIANRASEILGGPRGDYARVSPNDQVNMSQSTNDVFPTAGRIMLLKMIPRLVHEEKRLYLALERKAEELDDVVKMGRTQLQDAVPIRMGQTFHAYAQAVRRDIIRLSRVEKELLSTNMGGTAVGTSLNAKPEYVAGIHQELQQVTGLELVPARDLLDATQNLDSFVSLSGALKIQAVTLSKMANDLRLLSSGPKAGIGEISLPARQNGSSIMPGKVNPVIPEVVNQVAFAVMGNDFTVTMAAEAGQLELNAFEPVIFDRLYDSLSMLTEGLKTFTDHCIQGITAHKERCAKQVHESIGLVTVLCPAIGYKKAADLAKKALAMGISVKDLVLAEGLMDFRTLEKALDPHAMTGPHREKPSMIRAV